MIEMVIKLYVRAQNLFRNIPCMHVTNVHLLHFCMSGCCVQGPDFLQDSDIASAFVSVLVVRELLKNILSAA